MPAPPATNHLAAEALAVADSIRALRTAFVRQVAWSDPPAAIMPHVSTLLCCGMDVAKALEEIARILGESQ